MKKYLLSLIMAVVVLALGSATTFAASPTDKEVISAYHAANQIFDWYGKNPLPTNGKSKYEQGYMIYYNVDSPIIHSFADLRRETEMQFTPAFTSLLISNTRIYKNVNGILYVAPANRGDNIFAGNTTFRVLRDATKPDVITLQTSTAIYESPSHTGKITKYDVKTFPYVNTPNGWRFSDFQSVK